MVREGFLEEKVLKGAIGDPTEAATQKQKQKPVAGNSSVPREPQPRLGPGKQQTGPGQPFPKVPPGCAR